MVDTALIPAIKEAIKQNEIGNASPYELSYARLGASGASFGVFQGDTNVSHTARATLAAALRARGADEPTVARILGLVGQPCPDGNPLSPEDTDLANAALSSPGGRQLVDQMDDGLLQIVLHGADACIAAAQTRSRTIAPVAVLYIALWVNMTGPPNVLSSWLAGNAQFGVPPAAGPVVLQQDIESYLHATKFFVLHPRNFVHLQQSVLAAIPKLPPSATA
jgi:hypothetical protein